MLELADVVAAAAGAGWWTAPGAGLLLGGCHLTTALGRAWLGEAPDEVKAGYPDIASGAADGQG